MDNPIHLADKHANGLMKLANEYAAELKTLGGFDFTGQCLINMLATRSRNEEFAKKFIEIMKKMDPSSSDNLPRRL